MKRNRQYAWLLMMVSLIMMVASVVPHHHHLGMSICMQSDVESCLCTCPDTSHQHSGQACSDACITQFQCSAPQLHSDWLQLPSMLFFDIYTIFDICCPGFFDAQAKEYACGYVERLHPLDIPGNMGGRAPPFA